MASHSSRGGIRACDGVESRHCLSPRVEGMHDAASRSTDTQANVERAKTLLGAVELAARPEGLEALPGAALHAILGKTTNGDTPSPQSVRSKPQSVRTPALVDVDNQGSTPVDVRSTKEGERQPGHGSGTRNPPRHGDEDGGGVLVTEAYERRPA